jgi:putative hemolysin
MPPWALWLGCLSLLFIRALIAAAESALYGTSDLRARELASSNPGPGTRVLHHKLHREATAASVRSGMVIFGFLAASIGALAPPRIFHLDVLDGSIEVLVAALAGALLVGAMALSTDVIFRGLANAAPERWALRLSGLVSLLVGILNPFMRLMLAIVNLFGRPFGARVRFEQPAPPLEELEKLLTARAAAEGMDKGAPALIRSIFEMSDKRCREIMVPRTDVAAVDISSEPDEILRALAEDNHSRIPVYRDDIDHIVGVLHARDLIPLLDRPQSIVLQDVIRPAHFVPWMKPIGDLLREMQQARIHMAMVVDEYGGFMGIVTLEDILREIVGDIGDEFEVEEDQVERLADGSYLVDASIDVETFSSVFDVIVPEGDYETLGGFLSNQAGSLPEIGERFTHSGLLLTVQEKEGARLDRVRVQRLKTALRETEARPSTPSANQSAADA